MLSVAFVNLIFVKNQSFERRTLLDVYYDTTLEYYKDDLECGKSKAWIVLKLKDGFKFCFNKPVICNQIFALCETLNINFFV